MATGEAAAVGPEQVQEPCTEILAKGPDITSADRWTDSSRPSGLVITFSSGARLWTGITTAGAISADSTPAAHATAPPLPTLFDSAGKITAARAEQYLAAVLMAAHAPEITSAYGYSSTSAARHPGVGLHLAGGARAFLPFVYTAAHGKKPAARPFTIDAAF
ncbi:hypothetical protein OG883_44455 [Streptomyces sp. NBC_01142]|uniref:hypothetical protein n=1 Tax=Streptomyces sp. NBC_01142 TaxID=2975865 RepID=UPI002256BE3F|nr:hypothetical protein [Streptomyces sp. NBC_01142]MCX4826697.1 hypothetical protein [Streptomyces sp. NBC_01142]